LIQGLKSATFLIKTKATVNIYYNKVLTSSQKTKLQDQYVELLKQESHFTLGDLLV